MIANTFGDSNNKVVRIYHLILNIIITGKTIEAISFIYWEIKHRFKIFPQKKYMKFSEESVLALNESLFIERKQAINYLDSTYLITSVRAFTYSFIDINNNVWFSSANYPNRLFKTDDSINGDTQLMATFEEPIKAIYVAPQKNVLISSGGKVWLSESGEKEFSIVLEFSHKESYFRHGHAVAKMPNGDLFIGEYCSIWNEKKWHFAAYLYQSSNCGKSWQTIDFLKNLKVNKHIHTVRYSKNLQGLLMNDGDNYKTLWINQSFLKFDEKSEDCWKKINKFHAQKGGYTATEEYKNTVLLGSDYLGGTNFLIFMNKNQTTDYQIVPDPYRQSYFTNIKVRKNSNTQQNEIWATIHSSFSDTTKSLLIYSVDDGQTWIKVFDYSGKLYDVDIIQDANYSPVSEIHLMIRNKSTGQIISKVVKNLTPNI